MKKTKKQRTTKRLSFRKKSIKVKVNVIIKPKQPEVIEWQLDANNDVVRYNVQYYYYSYGKWKVAYTEWHILFGMDIYDAMDFAEIEEGINWPKTKEGYPIYSTQTPFTPFTY